MKEKDNLFEPVLNTEVIYEGKYLNLNRLEIRLPDGNTGFREVVKVSDAVAVLPVDSDGYAHLVKQHRVAVERTILEVPAGLIDSGEDAETAARRECEEETGYIPGRLIKLMTYAHAEGYSTGFITLFLGLDLEHTGKVELDRSEFLERYTIPYSKLLEQVKNNQFIDSKTILTSILSEPYLNNK